MDKDVALNAVRKELERAMSLHPPYHSPHEGFGVIHEEFDELWEEIKKHDKCDVARENMKEEAVQLATVAIRFLIDCCRDAPQQ